jgi:threonine dehydrogenase-like Zn-dependent dehydrogenase
VKALCWEGVGDLKVRDVPEPAIHSDRDAIIRVLASSVCGSDLHLIKGYLPAMRDGDILGHEFMGEVVEAGPAVHNVPAGDRVVVGSVLACGGCWYCRTEQFSLCDNSNPQPNLAGGGQGGGMGPQEGGQPEMGAPSEPAPSAAAVAPPAAQRAGART